MAGERRVELREQVRGLFKHGYEGYMQHAYPADELRPLSCAPLHRDPDPDNFGINDIHANASITLLDVLSSLPRIHPAAFPDAVQKVATEISFDQDVKVQVFEMTIRAMGSLLSTYQYLDRLPDDPKLQAQELGLAGGGVVWWKKAKGREVDLKMYKGRILELALDLGTRLLPAFETPTGLPYARVNLRSGVEPGESVETCTAGAGSLILEFAVLTRLTGDERFEALASRAYIALWNRRSTHNLLGNTIGVTHGHWLMPGMATVGAGMDSYYEYGLKAGILLNDDIYLDIWQDTYAAVQTHIRTPAGFIYRPTHFRALTPPEPSMIDSLSAFFPGMQVLAGDIESAIRSHLVFWNLWRKYDAMPESWSWIDRKLEWKGYPGRPEFIESTYYLYQATKDPFYLRVGERILKDISRRTKTACGFATMKNVETGELEDRMESFVLSESLKYLFLLFDPTPSKRLTNQIFTTEGHLLSLPHAALRPPSAARRKLHRGENLFCPAYSPPKLGGLVVGIERRMDYEYARSLVFGKGVEGRAIEHKEAVGWWEAGYCTVPLAPKYSFDIVLTPLNLPEAEVPPEDPAPSLSKVWRVEASGHFVIADVSGLRLGVRWRMDNSGYDVVSIGPHRVRPGQQVVVTDPKMEGYLPVPATPPQSPYKPFEVMLRFSTGEKSVFLHAPASTATFGRPLGTGDGEGLGFVIGGSSVIFRPTSNVDGCRPFKTSEIGKAKGLVFMIDRGGCTFLQKALNAGVADAGGLLFVGNKPAAGDGSTADPPGLANGEEAATGQSEGLIRPSADGEPEALLHKVRGIGIVYVEYMVGEVVLRAMEEQGTVLVEVLCVDGGAFATAGTTGETRDHGGRGESVGETIGQGGEREERATEMRREGRVMVADWEIRNVRIMERPP